MPDEVIAPLFIGVDNHFGIRARREAVPLALELRPQLSEVVDLPVLHRPDRAVFVGNRLVTTGEIDDAETATPERRRRPPRCAVARRHTHDALIIRTSMTNRAAHPLDEPIRYRGTVKPDDTGYPAHD